jgi:hypothetical protein
MDPGKTRKRRRTIIKCKFCGTNNVLIDGFCEEHYRENHHLPEFYKGIKEKHLKYFISSYLLKQWGVKDLIYNKKIKAIPESIIRPDIHFSVGGNCFFVIEIDEFAHKGNNYKHTEKGRTERIKKCSRDGVDFDVVFLIRINPDKYIDENGEEQPAIWVPYICERIVTAVERLALKNEDEYERRTKEIAKILDKYMIYALGKNYTSKFYKETEFIEEYLFY